MWSRIVSALQEELSDKELSTWIHPLQADISEHDIVVMAPNPFVSKWIDKHYSQRIAEIAKGLNGGQAISISIRVGNLKPSKPPASSARTTLAEPTARRNSSSHRPANTPSASTSNTNTTVQRSDFASRVRAEYTFDRFVAGKSNQIAEAAAHSVAERPGDSQFNPLFIYGGVGLGKTHLMHAAGNEIVSRNPDAKVVYLHSEKFVGDMVRALRHGTIDEFKRFYRSAEVLLIDDIQFFAGKDRSQDEFFHTFNSLLERKQQVILTCDRFPRDVEKLEERLKSRFGWGLTVAIEPPELETRVAILKNKAAESGLALNDDIAFFVGQHVRSNVRELEGALKKIVAQHNFTGLPLTVDFAREALRDLLASQDKLITVENIQRIVAEMFKIRQSDMLSRKRTRTISWPRQVAMALAKELTNHSLPELGRQFGNRDHTTVMHACKKVAEKLETDGRFRDEFDSLKRILNS